MIYVPSRGFRDMNHEHDMYLKPYLFPPLQLSFCDITLQQISTFLVRQKKNSHYRQKYGFKLKICISIQAGTGVILIALMHSFGNLSQASYSTFESKKFQSSHYEQRSSDSVLHECHMTIRISHLPLF